jgi:hypothetical protein
MESDGSCFCLKKPATGLYPEPNGFSPHPQTLFKTHSNIILKSTPRFLKCSLPFRFSDQNFVLISYFKYACYIVHLFNHYEPPHNAIFSQPSVILSLTSKYSPQNPVLKQPLKTGACTPKQGDKEVSRYKM